MSKKKKPTKLYYSGKALYMKGLTEVDIVSEYKFGNHGCVTDYVISVNGLLHRIDKGLVDSNGVWSYGDQVGPDERVDQNGFIVAKNLHIDKHIGNKTKVFLCHK